MANNSNPELKATDKLNCNGSKSDEDERVTFRRYEYLNPFVHNLDIEDKFDLAKIYILTVVLVPIRTLLMITAVLCAWMFACIGQYGLTSENLSAKPLTGWRKQMQKLTAFSMRQIYGAGSFHYIKIIGEQAQFKEAPILVIAPHSSYVDSLAVVSMGPPAIVAKQDTAQIPIFGKLINFSQPIYVAREDPNSRQNTIRQIIDRANSLDWSQIAIFPEGTCTNRKALIQFKPGAFIPGVPVQPVVLRYPNKYDTFTWTWNGPGVLRILWITIAQFYNRFEMEFLPVYNPSEEEKNNPKLFATNVRAVMAKALNVPVANYSFEDCIIMNKAKEMEVPFPSDIIEIEFSLHKLGLIKSNVVEEIAEDYFDFPNDAITFTTFIRLLKIQDDNEYVHRLFSLLNKNMTQHLSLKDFLICSFFVQTLNEAPIELLRLLKKVYCKSTYDMSRENFYNIVRHSRRFTKEKSDELFFTIDNTHKGSISFGEFERHVKQLSKYNFLFKQNIFIRRFQ